ncbi:NADH dehydrogenase (ubiquinone) complex I, assembly factor 6 [Halocaridina rubra]|uniref:NADH dehydrogenase (ubiquinone) complex I, assembly factor 6 n=1 Tax=Halocaridina rubra TaxID=373956 RepID=A0AAN8WMN6_HALRR
MVDTTQYCLNIVKKYDYENFLSVLLLPGTSRAAAFAVRAFNVEIAQIQDVTSQALIAKMRLQFWRDTLDDIFHGKSPEQPVAIELQRAVAKYKLSKRWLSSLIDSREDHLENKPFESLQSVEDYSEKSNSVLYYLILQSLGVENVHADHVASHLGKAEGITRLIRGVPHLSSRRIVLLPQDVLMAHKVSQENIIRGSQDQNVKDVVFDIASTAHHHIEHVKDLMKSVPKNARIGLLSHVSVSSYLDALQQVHFDVFNPALQRRNNLLPVRLWWAKFKG